MKGLLIKDLCNLRQVAKQSLIVLAVLAAWCVFLKNYQYDAYVYRHEL